MAKKVGGLLSGERPAPAAKKVVEAQQHSDVGWIDLEGEDPGYFAAVALAMPGRIYVVFGQDKRHAEVKLVKVLELAHYKGPAFVQGKKRPCYTCAAYMRLRKNQGYGLVFSDNPGKLWKDEYERSERDVQEEVKRSLASKVLSCKTESGEGWRSESDSGDEDDGKPVRAKTRGSAAARSRRGTASGGGGGGDGGGGDGDGGGGGGGAHAAAAGNRSSSPNQRRRDQ
jgi:hypothetical protein